MPTDTADTAALLTAVTAFEAELMQAQFLVGVLEALGGEVAEPAAAVGEIARRGAELLAGRVAR
jgi:hypothetical protein